MSHNYEQAIFSINQSLEGLLNWRQCQAYLAPCYAGHIKELTSCYAKCVKVLFGSPYEVTGARYAIHIKVLVPWYILIFPCMLKIKKNDVI